MMVTSTSGVDMREFSSTQKMAVKSLDNRSEEYRLELFWQWLYRLMTFALRLSGSALTSFRVDCCAMTVRVQSMQHRRIVFFIFRRL